MGKFLRTLLLAAPLLLAACSHPVYLKSFEASAPAQAGLNGRTVYLEPIVDQRDPQKQEWKESQPREDPPGFKFKELGAHKGTWEAERNQLQSQISEDKWHKLGHQRNGFGIPIKDVKSVNAPWKSRSPFSKLDGAVPLGGFTPQSASLPGSAYIDRVPPV